MKKAIATFGLFSMMMILTSFTSNNEIGGQQHVPRTSTPINLKVMFPGDANPIEIGGQRVPGTSTPLSIGGQRVPTTSTPLAIGGQRVPTTSTPLSIG